MSTLRVDNINSQVNNSAPTIAGLQHPTAGPLSNRNLIINGAMQIGQRDNLANQTAALYGRCDRFRATVGGGTNKNYDFEQVAGCRPQDGFPFGLEYTNRNVVNPGANDFVGISQIIEGQNLQSIRKGTADAQPITLSFWARSSRTGTYVVDLFDQDNNRQVSQAYDLTAATWEHVVLTFPADTTGAFDNDNGGSLFVNWWLGAGADLAGGGSLNTVWNDNTQNERAVGVEASFLGTAGSTFNLTGVQLEVGSVDTPFEHRSFDQELAACQRYFQRHASGSYIWQGNTNAGTSYNQSCPLPVTLRAVPGNANVTNIVTSASATWNAPTVNLTTQTSVTLFCTANANTSASFFFVGFDVSAEL